MKIIGIFTRLAIRDNKTYAGFWHSDIYGTQDIPTNTWTHIVFRYEFAGQNLSIFVNGKKDIEVSPYASFLGEGRLLLRQNH